MRKLSQALILRGFFIIFLLCISISCARGNTSSENDNEKTYKIRVAYMPDFSGTSAAVIAKEKGFFKEENLDVELVKFISGPSEVAAMISGDIQFAYIGHGAHSLAIQRKVDILLPNGLSKSEQIIAGKWSGINDVSGLKGKTVATQLGTSGDIVLNLALETAGINKKDVKIVNMDMGGAVSAFLSKKIDALSVWAPYTFEIKKRIGDEAVIIATINEYLDRALFPSSWIATSEYLKKNPEIAKSFTRAILKSMDYRAQNMDETVKLVAVLNGTPIDSVELEKETATWLNSKDIKKSYDDGTAEKWYEAQAKIFLDYGIITEIIEVPEYVRFDIIKEAMGN